MESQSEREKVLIIAKLDFTNISWQSEDLLISRDTTAGPSQCQTNTRQVYNILAEDDISYSAIFFIVRSRVIRDFILLDSPREQVVLDNTNHETFERFCIDVLAGGETVAVICDCSDQRPCVSSAELRTEAGYCSILTSLVLTLRPNTLSL